MKLCDFGIAKQVKQEPKPHDPTSTPATATATLTVAGSLVRHADYMSPEQAKGARQIDAAATSTRSA